MDPFKSWLCSEKEAEKDTREGAKKDEIEREKSMKNSGIGFSSPSPESTLLHQNRQIYLIFIQRPTPARDPSGDELAAAMGRLEESISTLDEFDDFDNAELLSAVKSTLGEVYMS